MRSYLFVPADDERKLARAATCGADALIIDLEDSVSPQRKIAARQIAAGFLAGNAAIGPKLFVRINPLTSGLAADDLAAIMPAKPGGIMQPKSRSAADAVTLAAMLRRYETELGLPENTTRLVVLITESAAAAQATSGYDAAGPRLEGLTWGCEDLGSDIGSGPARDETGAYTGVFALARATTLLAAASARVSAIDTVYPDFRDRQGFARDCAAAVRDGFSAKLAIHPSQVPVINQAFTPTPAQISDAKRIVAAFMDSETGVAALDGRMLDRPHLVKAQRLLKRIGAAATATATADK